MNRDVEQQVWQRVLAVGASPGESPADGTGGNGSGGGLSEAGRTVFRQRPGVASASARYADGDACLSAGESGGCPAVGAEKQRRSPFRRSRQRRRWKSGITAPGAVTDYTARTVDGDFGVVFQHLADLSREECVLLARLLGNRRRTFHDHREDKPGHDPPQGSHVRVLGQS